MVFYMDVPIEGGSPVRVEVEAPEGGLVPAAADDDTQVGRLSESLDKAMDRIRPMAEVITGKLAGMAVRPDSVTAEFGMKFSVDAGVIVARTASEAQISVKLTWGKEE